MPREIIFEGIAYRRFNAAYAVSACGKVLLLRSWRPAKQHFRRDGYLQVRGELVHRMVATCWVRPPKKGEVCHHKDHDKAHNRDDNLEWLTPKQHMGEKHADAVGRYERTPETRAKLRKYRLGKKQTQETKNKIGQAIRELGIRPPIRTEPHRPESRAKMRENSPNAVRCRIKGVEYRSFSEAGRALGEKPHTLRKRCLSETSFPDHEILTE